MKRKYWYRVEMWECPLCMAGKTYRFRVYNEAEKGYHYVTDYDYCNV